MERFTERTILEREQTLLYCDYESGKRIGALTKDVGMPLTKAFALCYAAGKDEGKRQANARAAKLGRRVYELTKANKELDKLMNGVADRLDDFVDLLVELQQSDLSGDVRAVLPTLIEPLRQLIEALMDARKAEISATPADNTEGQSNE